MQSFNSCRRAWDLGSRVRQNYVPVVPRDAFDFDKAIHNGLAVYYFPAMGDWNRSIVRPLALQGFHRSMREDRTAYEAVRPLSAGQRDDWDWHSRLGEVALGRYLQWAVPADEDFDSLFADQDIWVPVPDPARPGQDFTTLDGRPLRFLCRIDQLVSDVDDEFWLVDHRLVWEDWESDETLLGDTDGLRAMWAVEIAYPQITLAGTIYNELRVSREDVTEPVSADDAADDLWDMSGARHINLNRSPATPVKMGVQRDEISGRDGNDHVRRTFIRRARSWIDAIGREMAEQTVQMRDPDIPVPPSPAKPRCAQCAFLDPCTAMDAGADVDAVLAAGFRRRVAEEFEDDSLRRSPTRNAVRASLGGVASREGGTKNARFMWG
jgi:hypothetical protein